MTELRKQREEEERREKWAAIMRFFRMERDDVDLLNR